MGGKPLKIIEVAEAETLDVLDDKGIKIIQSKIGYRFNEDSLILADFVEEKEGDVVADFGTGCGIIGILIAMRRKANKVYGIEIQDSLLKCAERNAVINRISHIFKPLKGDIKKIPEFMDAEICDVVVTNPPYVRKGEGRISAITEKAIARVEIMITLPLLLKSAGYVLKEGGRFYAIYPAKRSLDISTLAPKFNIQPAFLKYIYRGGMDKGDVILFKGIKKSGF